MNRYTQLLLLIIAALPHNVTATAVTANDSMVSAIESWGRQLGLDPGVIAEIGRFEHGGRHITQEDARVLARSVRGMVFEATLESLREVVKGNRERRFDVTYMDPGFAGVDEKKLPKEVRELEDGFVRTEFRTFVPCEDFTTEAVLRIYTSKELRMKSSSRTKRIWTENDRNCVETTGKMFVPAMMSCNRITELHGDGFSAQHSQVVSNPGVGDYQPVYFKESVKTIVRVQGGFVLHYINLTRSKKVNSLAKGFVRSAIEDTQDELVALLEQRLNGAVTTESE